MREFFIRNVKTKSKLKTFGAMFFALAILVFGGLGLAKISEVYAAASTLEVSLQNTTENENHRIYEILIKPDSKFGKSTEFKINSTAGNFYERDDCSRDPEYTINTKQTVYLCVDKTVNEEISVSAKAGEISSNTLTLGRNENSENPEIPANENEEKSCVASDEASLRALAADEENCAEITIDSTAQIQGAGKGVKLTKEFGDFDGNGKTYIVAANNYGILIDDSYEGQGGISSSEITISNATFKSADGAKAIFDFISAEKITLENVKIDASENSKQYANINAKNVGEIIFAGEVSGAGNGAFIDYTLPENSARTEMKITENGTVSLANGAAFVVESINGKIHFEKTPSADFVKLPSVQVINGAIGAWGDFNAGVENGQIVIPPEEVEIPAPELWIDFNGEKFVSGKSFNSNSGLQLAWMENGENPDTYGGTDDRIYANEIWVKAPGATDFAKSTDSAQFTQISRSNEYKINNNKRFCGADGIYEFYVSSVSGEKSAKSNVVSLTCDKTVPKLVKIERGAKYTGKETFKLTATFDEPVCEITLKKGTWTAQNPDKNGCSKIWTNTATESSLCAATNLLNFTDRAGNSSSDNSYDCAAPTAEISYSPEKEIWTKDSVIATIKTDEPVKISADGWTAKNPDENGFATEWTKTFAGNSTENVEICDANQNCATVEVKVENIDKTAPTAKITSTPKAGEVAKNDCAGCVNSTISGTIDDKNQSGAKSVKIYLRPLTSAGKLGSRDLYPAIDATVNADGTFSANFDTTILTSGTYGYDVDVCDNLGNCATYPQRDGKGFIIDNDVPKISVVSPQRYEISYGEKYVDKGYSAADSRDGNLTDKVVATYNYNDGSGNWQYNIPLDTTKAGRWTVWYYATDSACNKSARATREFTVLPAPTFTVSFDVDGGSAVDNLTNVKSGATISAPENPTRDGYTFVNWVDENGAVFDFANTPITADTTIYAKWQKVAENENNSDNSDNNSGENSNENSGNSETEAPTTSANPQNPTVSVPISRANSNTNSANFVAQISTSDENSASETSAENSNSAEDFTAISNSSLTNSANSDENSDATGEVLGAQDEKHWALLNLILAVLTAICSVILLLAWLGKDEKDDNRHGILRVLTLVPAVGAVVAFLLTEDWTLPLKFVDVWTILMAIIFAVQIILAIFATRHNQNSANSGEKMQLREE